MISLAVMLMTDKGQFISIQAKEVRHLVTETVTEKLDCTLPKAPMDSRNVTYINFSFFGRNSRLVSCFLGENEFPFILKATIRHTIIIIQLLWPLRTY